MLDLPTVHHKPNAGSAIDGENCKSKLFTPLKIKNTVIKNRIFVAPMDQYSAALDGKPNSYHFVHYGALAHRGAGLIMIEATSVKENGRISYADIGLWNDDQIDPFKSMVDFMHFHGSVVGVQLAHGGRKSSGLSKLVSNEARVATNEENGWPNNIVGPSPIPFSNKWSVPHELTKEEIKDIVKAFGDAAKRADKAGIDVVEIHAAHGYLLHEFLSPITNHRTDDYGGSFENRCRLCIEVINSVKEQWPKEKPIFIRFSCSDWIEGGWDVEQTARLTKIVQSLGVDFVDCSSGGLSEDQNIVVGPGYQVPFAKEVKQQNPNILVGAVGIITKGKQAEEILEKGYADAISVGRPFLIDTSLVLNWAKEINTKIYWPLQLVRGKLTMDQ